MVKTQNTFLNTPPCSPVRYQDAPRNTIPGQVLLPLPTSRVAVKFHHPKIKPVRLYQKTLQRISTHPIGRQPLQRFRPKQEQVELLPLEKEIYSSSSQPLLSLHPTPLPSTALPSLQVCAPSPSTALSQLQERVFPHDDREADKSLSKRLSRKRSTDLCVVPLQKQSVSLRPIFAVQHPVKTRATLVSRKRAPLR